MFPSALFFIFNIYLFFDFVKPQCDPTNVLTCPSGCCQDSNTCSTTFNFSLMNPIQAGCYSIDCNVVTCGIDYCCTNNGCQSGNCTAAASSTSKRSSVFRIVGIVVLVVIILCIIGCCVYCIRRRMKRKKQMENEELERSKPPHSRYQQAGIPNNSSTVMQPSQGN